MHPNNFLVIWKTLVTDTGYRKYGHGKRGYMQSAGSHGKRGWSWKTRIVMENADIRDFSLIKLSYFRSSVRKKNKKQFAVIAAKRKKNILRTKDGYKDF